MNRFEHQSSYNCSTAELYQWHARPGALQRLLPPWENTEVISNSGGIEPGAEVKLKMHFGPFAFSYKARHTKAIPGKMFQDIQAQGPFTSWSHSHYFKTIDNRTTLLDSIEYQLPLQKIIPAAVLPFVNKKLKKLFLYRSKLLQEDIALHQRCSTRPLTILISGASGSIGRDLVPLLTTGGHKVWTLVRRAPNPQENEIFWDPAKGILNPGDIPEIDSVIHLAGEYIGLNRWTQESKKRVLESRVRGTTLLAETIAKLDRRPDVFLCASAVGFYGNCNEKLIDEDQKPGSHFMSEVCASWENAAQPADAAGIRTVYLRLGVGLSPKSGALRRILSTSPLGFHRYFGPGNQYISWISNDDIISAILHTLATPTLSGAVNIVAPKPVTNRELMQLLSKITGRPRLFPVPAKPLLFVYGQMAAEILLSGCKVSSKKLQDSGYTFRHPDLETALRFMLGQESP